MILNTTLSVSSNRRVAEGIYALRFCAPDIARTAVPGQFVNILVGESYEPLLRRPYSVANIYDDECEILYAVVGKGTNILSHKQPGDTIGVLGPLGNGFGYEKEFGTAIMVAGGIGVAPMPFLNTKLIMRRDVEILSFVGARTAAQIVPDGLVNLHTATDDGSEGFHGNIIECLGEWLSKKTYDRPMIFACGPTPMLRAAQRFANENSIACELSLESEMACGIGICQGCPIIHNEADRKYALVCTDGPCFDSTSITFREDAL